MGCCLDLIDGASGGGGAAASWALTLVAGQISGGTDAVMSVGDALRGVDTAAAGPAGTLDIHAGDHSGVLAGDDGGAIEVAGGDAGVGGPSFSVGGDALFRGGDLLSTGNQRGGNAVFRSGEGNLASTAEFAAGNVRTANAGGLATFHGGDNTDSGVGGDCLVRGGNAILGAGNDVGGDTAVTGGLARNIADGGDLFLRSGLPTTSSSSGLLRITTNVTNALGPSPAGGNTGSGTGAIQIDTTGLGTIAPSSGDITLETGSIAVGATGGTGPGQITLTGGSLANTGQSFVDAGGMTFTGGNNAGATSAPAGGFAFVGGNQTGTGAGANSFAGGWSFVGGNSAHNSVSSGGGAFSVIAGNSTSVNGPGGSVSLTAGDISNVAAAGLAGAVTVTAGSVTNAGSGQDGGSITLNAGTAAGAGITGDVFCNTRMGVTGADPADADPAADDFVIGQVALATTGLTIQGAVGTIAFADAALADPGRWVYSHAQNRMTWTVNNNARMRLNGTVLTPNAAGGTSLGSDAIPWGNVFHQSQNVATLDSAGPETLDATDWMVVISGAGAVTLPASAAATEGRVYAVANQQLAASTTVNPNGADTINGAASVTIGSSATAFFVLVGTDWISWEAPFTT